MTKIGFLFALVSLCAFHASASPAKTLPVVDAKKDLILEINGRIFPKDSIPEDCKTLLQGGKCASESFGRYHFESRREGDLIKSKAIFSGPDGDQAVEESVEKNGHVQSIHIVNKALGKTYDIQVNDRKITYKTTMDNGTVKTSEEEFAKDHPQNFVAPSTIMSYIRPSFSKILAGEEINLRIIVPDRQETFSFNMKKLKDAKDLNGEDIVVLKMSPGSFFVKALVDPMYFYLNPKTGEMFAFDGRSSLRRKVDGKYKEMDVHVSYSYVKNDFNFLKQSKDAGQNSAVPGTTVGSTNCSTGTMIGVGKDAKCEVKSQ